MKLVGTLVTKHMMFKFKYYCELINIVLDGRCSLYDCNLCDHYLCS